MAAGASPGRIDRRPARAAAADAVGHTEVAWPRGLPCDLFVRAIVEREGFMRSGGVVIGGGTTRLIAYRYRRGANDATDATRPGTYAAGLPIRIQWNRPLPGARTYPVELTLTVETTYDDGTVRRTQVVTEPDQPCTHSNERCRDEDADGDPAPPKRCFAGSLDGCDRLCHPRRVAGCARVGPQHRAHGHLTGRRPSLAPRIDS
jgi:hypothetical protein